MDWHRGLFDWHRASKRFESGTIDGRFLRSRTTRWGWGDWALRGLENRLEDRRMRLLLGDGIDVAGRLGGIWHYARSRALKFHDFGFRNNFVETETAGRA